MAWTEQSTVPVSVLIATFNSRETLTRSIASLYSSKSALPDEILVVDDASDDGTAELASELGVQFPQVRLIPRRSNGGAAAARLDGALAARNPLIAILDSDDYLGPGAVALAYETLKRDNADYCTWQLRREVGGESWILIDTSNLVFPITGREAARLTLGSWRLCPLGVMRRDLFISACHQVNVESFNRDELISRAALLQADRVTECPAAYHYVMNPQSATRSERTNRVGLIGAHRWLTDFAFDNGYLSEEPALAAEMVGQGITLGLKAIGGSLNEQPNQTSPMLGDLVNLMRRLREVNPKFVLDRSRSFPKSLAHNLWRPLQLKRIERIALKRIH